MHDDEFLHGKTYVINKQTKKQHNHTNVSLNSFHDMLKPWLPSLMAVSNAECRCWYESYVGSRSLLKLKVRKL